jgi:hypothetical protein
VYKLGGFKPYVDNDKVSDQEDISEQS